MPLGDSITEGDAYKYRPVSERFSYRQQLWYMLQDASYDVDFVGSRVAGDALVPKFDPDHEGYPGETSYDIANRVYGLLQKNPPDIILLHVGANDWDSSVDGIRDILDNINRYESDYHHHIKVILAQILNRQVYQDWMSEMNRNIYYLAMDYKADGDDIVLVDMENGAGIDYDKDFEDTTHPNRSGYKKMATVWFNAIKQYLPKKDRSYMVPIINLILD
ncbi:MAG: GDSL-type esterase/lipase family protein [bacterium]